ncbi:hypothetical protein [Paraburkholderia bannensis]|uniref:hypothetical protein n=1 Tax=Paraburkholderia bannensis TaxID=765414 RepID=UPI002ABDE755|nr:hypothetical protein [Paraburkholderia bannensis]
MSEKPLKAYKVDVESHDAFSCIVFATNSASARRAGASELDACWEDVELCRRAPAYDHYAPGPVPNDVLLEDGWWFECHGCTNTVRADGTRVEDGSLIECGKYIVRAQEVFCTQACLARHDASKRMNVAAQAALIELVETKFPGSKIDSVYVYGDKLEASETGLGALSIAYFTFPGAQGLAEYRFGDGAYVSRMDLELFESRYCAA